MYCKLTLRWVNNRSVKAKESSVVVFVVVVVVVVVVSVSVAIVFQSLTLCTLNAGIVAVSNRQFSK